MIIRNKLLRIFESLSKKTIVYVCAPAGYGKTAAVRQWLDSDACPRAVVSLDWCDNTVTHFCQRFCAALYTCQPENTALAEISAHPAFGNAPEEFTLRAIAALSDIERMAIVIEDLYFINNEGVLRLIPTLIKRLPKTFRVFIINRDEPPAVFSDLRLKGDLAMITTEQLRFSAEEIMLFYKKRGVSLTMGAAGEIRRYTDGWIIGINALLLSGDNADGEIFGALDTFIETYVWRYWDERTREFLLKMSVLRDITPGICSALTGIAGSEGLLHSLMLGGAFICQTSAGVYQFHRLFLDFVVRRRMERGIEYTRELLDKAGYWYLSAQDFYSAVQYFIQSENYDGIAGCAGVLPVLGNAYVPSETLMPVVTSPVFLQAAEKHPRLYSLLAWTAFNDGRAEDMAKYADLYYSHQTSIVLEGPYAALGVFLIRLIDFRFPLQSLALTASKIAVHIGRAADVNAESKIVNQNMPLLHRGTRDLSECAKGDTEANISAILNRFGNFFGDEANLLAECIMAGLLYEQGHLERAHVHALAANAEILEHFSAETKFFTMAVLVYTFDASGQLARADRVIGEIAGMIERHRAYHLRGNYDALVLRRKLSAGGIKAAGEWLSGHITAPGASLLFYRIYEYITTCRAYITAGEYDSAIILLRGVLGLQTAYKRPLGIIETKILLSISFWKKKRGFQRDAMRYLKEAVSEAYNYRYTQMFANEGAELFGMLRRLQRSAVQRGGTVAAPVSFIKMLYLKALEHQEGGLTSGQTESAPKFTDKQRAVMKLLYEGKSFREITKIIGIKLPTLRSHISLIYKKLDVTSRTDAIMKIKSLGICD